MPSKIILEDDSGFLLQEGAGDFLLLEGTYFDDVRQDLIDGFVSAQSDTNGWNELLSGIALSSMVRTSNSVYTFTIPAIGAFDITQTHNITNTVPAVALVGGAPIIATPTMTITISAGAFSLNCAPGAYSMIGFAAGILAQRMINAALGTYSLTGLAASIVTGRAINAALGTYSLVGLAATLLANRMINGAFGIYNLTGISASPIADRIINTEAGFVSYVGIGTGLYYTPVTGFSIDAEPGNYSLVGSDADFLADRILVLEHGVYTITGVASILEAQRLLALEPGTYTIIGSVSNLIVERIINAASGNYALTGNDADLVVAVTGYIINAESGSYLITGRNTKGQLEFDVFPIGSGSAPTPQIIND